MAIRSRSLIPGIVFHLLFNSLGVLHSQFTEQLKSATPGWLESGFGKLLFTIVRSDSDEPVALRFDFPLLAVCGVVTLLLIRTLIRMKPASQDSASPEVSAELAVNS